MAKHATRKQGAQAKARTIAARKARATKQGATRVTRSGRAAR